VFATPNLELASSRETGLALRLCCLTKGTLRNSMRFPRTFDRGRTKLHVHALETLDPSSGVPTGIRCRVAEADLAVLVLPKGRLENPQPDRTCLSYFIQAPPDEFKEHRRFVTFPAVLTDQSWGQSCSGVQGSDMQIARRQFTTASLRSQHLMFLPNHQSQFQAYRRVTHQTPASRQPGRRAHQRTRSTQPTMSANIEYQPERLHCPNDNITTLSEDRLQIRPRQFPAYTRSRSKQPIESSSRPSVQAVERSVLHSLVRTGMTP